MQTMTKAQQEQKAIVRDQKVRRDLQSKYNYTPEQANGFVAQMSSPDSLSLDNLVQLHPVENERRFTTGYTGNPRSSTESCSNESTK